MYEQIARNKRRTVGCVGAFFVIWLGIGALVGWLWAILAGPVRRPEAAVEGDLVAGLVVAALFAAIGIAFSLTLGPRTVLAVSGARPADPKRFRVVQDLVEALAIGEGIPKPDVYVIDDPSPNAFATGTSPDRAAVTVTTGLLAMMNREELEGVLAHEMSHIKNYDVRLLLVVSTLIGMAGLLASLAWRSAFLTRSRGRQSGQVALLVMLACALLIVVALIFGPLVRLALSRQRESLADVSGVALTRNPAGLIRALKKLQANDQPFARFNHATAAMCIDDPLQHHENWYHHLFDTHPPIEQRIAVLEQITYGRAA